MRHPSWQQNNYLTRIQAFRWNRVRISNREVIRGLQLSRLVPGMDIIPSSPPSGPHGWLLWGSPTPASRHRVSVYLPSSPEAGNNSRLVSYSTVCRGYGSDPSRTSQSTHMKSQPPGGGSLVNLDLYQGVTAPPRRFENLVKFPGQNFMRGKLGGGGCAITAIWRPIRRSRTSRPCSG
jgi:hypothetical protein